MGMALGGLCFLMVADVGRLVGCLRGSGSRIMVVFYSVSRVLRTCYLLLG